MNTGRHAKHGVRASRARWAAAAGMGFFAGAIVVGMSPSFAAGGTPTPSPTQSQSQLQDKAPSSSSPSPSTSAPSSQSNGNGGSTDNGSSGGATDNGGGSGAAGLTAGNGTVNTGMTLKSAKVTQQNLNDTNEEYVTFTFSRPVINVANQQGFVLQGYSSKAQMDSHDAKIVHGHPDQVLAGYPAGTDVRDFTAATVSAGAAMDESGRAALPNTTALGGSDGSIGPVDLPMLTSVSRDDTLNQITFHFDHNLNKDARAATAADLGFYTQSGRAVTGDSIVTTDLHDVTVQFKSQVRDAVRYFADSGAVSSASGLQNPPTAVGGRTVVPTLSSVSDLVGKTQVRYTFTQPVSSVTASDFIVYTPSGQAIPGSGYVKPASNVVQVAFPQIQRYGGSITLAAVKASAVKASDSSQAANTVGSMTLGGGSHDSLAGMTSGPDLKSASISTSTGQVEYIFNKPINDSATYKASNFQLVTGAGDVATASAVVGVDGDSITVDFDPTDARAAHTAAVSGGAVSNFQGDTNPLGTVAAQMK